MLDLPAVAFLNSADAPPRALDLTDALADRLAARGIAVVSGHNTSGYKAAAVAAVRHGAPRLLVLDRGLISAPREALDREPVAPARVWTPEWDGLAGLALSPFRPQDGWARANPRRRDEIVASLASGLVAIHVRAGGVMEAIARAAGSHGIWLGVWEGSEAGGARVLGEAARGVTKLAASDGLDAVAEQVAAAVQAGADRAPGRGRAARRWTERERHFLYSLLEAATGAPLKTEARPRFGDQERWPPGTGTADRTGGRGRMRRHRAAGRPPGAAGRTCFPGGRRMARRAGRAALSGGRGELAAMAGGPRLGGDDGRPSATPGGRGERRGAPAPRSGGRASGYWPWSPRRRLRTPSGQQRYLVEARRRVRAHLNLPRKPGRASAPAR